MSHKKRYALHKHHRKCRSNGGGNGPENISFVRQSKHDAWHHLFDNLSAECVAEIINRTWIDPAFELIVIRRTHDE